MGVPAARLGELTPADVARERPAFIRYYRIRVAWIVFALVGPGILQRRELRQRLRLRFLRPALRAFGVRVDLFTGLLVAEAAVEEPRLAGGSSSGETYRVPSTREPTRTLSGASTNRAAGTANTLVPTVRTFGTWATAHCANGFRRSPVGWIRIMSLLIRNTPKAALTRHFAGRMRAQ